jgi:hypothetical protein
MPSALLLLTERPSALQILRRMAMPPALRMLLRMAMPQALLLTETAPA